MSNISIRVSAIHEHRIDQKKYKITSFTHTETFNRYIIYIQEILIRIHKHAPDEQAVYEKDTKMLKVLLDVNGQNNSNHLSSSQESWF